MPFLSGLLKKWNQKKQKKNSSPVGKKETGEPSRSGPAAGDVLGDLRFKARTGDPKLTEKHRSGNF